MVDTVALWQDIVRDEMKAAARDVPAAARAGKAGGLTNAMKHAALVLGDPKRRNDQMALQEVAKLLGDAVAEWGNERARMELGSVWAAVQPLTWTPVDVVLHVRR